MGILKDVKQQTAELPEQKRKKGAKPEEDYLGSSIKKLEKMYKEYHKNYKSTAGDGTEAYKNKRAK